METDHIKEEIMAHSLYNALGVPVPNFGVYNHLPVNLIPNNFKQHFTKEPYLLAEFIEGRALQPSDLEKTKAFFVVDAFLANHDATRNVIVKTDGTVVRINNSGEFSSKDR